VRADPQTRAPAARWTALAANLAGLLLAVAFGVLTGFSGLQGPLLIAVFLTGAAALATSRRTHDRKDLAG
jgi:hypothetical protein